MIVKLKEYEEHIFIPIYDESITIIFTNNVAKSLNKIGVKSRGVSKIVGYTLDNDEIITSVFKFPVSINTLVHEVSHMVESILENRGIDPKGEPRAYLEGYLTEQIWEMTKKAKKDII